MIKEGEGYERRKSGKDRNMEEYREWKGKEREKGGEGAQKWMIYKHELDYSRGMEGAKGRGGKSEGEREREKERDNVHAHTHSHTVHCYCVFAYIPIRVTIKVAAFSTPIIFRANGSLRLP